MWNIYEMLITEYWTPTLFTYQNWKISFGLVTQSSNAKQSSMAKFPLFWNIIHNPENFQSTESSLNFDFNFAFLKLIPSCI